MLFPGMMNFRFGNNVMMFGYGMPMFSIINIVLYLFNVARNWYQNHRRDNTSPNMSGNNPDSSEPAESVHSREETDAAIRPVTDSLDMIIIVVITVVVLLYSILSLLVCRRSE